MSALDARGAITSACVLDLFAGTGALGFEALSRGATRLVAVDRDRRVTRAIQADARALGLAGETRVLTVDLGRDRDVAKKLAAEGPFDLVFADPPYDDAAIVPDLLRALANGGALADDALVVFEHAVRAPPALGEGLAQVAFYRYGDTAVSFVVTASDVPGTTPE
jgi:16S rRNA (guanine966-N2)-methyltransferase